MAHAPDSSRDDRPRGQPDVDVRPAITADVVEVARLINGYAELGLMLHRSLTDMFERVRDFHVAVDPSPRPDAPRVLGVCGLRIMWGDLGEIYALAVAHEARGRGLGGRLVEACVDDARRLGVRKLMSLTYEQRFFDKLGFSVVDRQQLPLKVWSECLRCPKNQACDEIAMLRELEDVPASASPQPFAPPPGEYVVPVTLSRVQPRVVRPTVGAMPDQ